MECFLINLLILNKRFHPLHSPKDVLHRTISTASTSSLKVLPDHFGHITCLLSYNNYRVTSIIILLNYIVTSVCAALLSQLVTLWGKWGKTEAKWSMSDEPVRASTRIVDTNTLKDNKEAAWRRIGMQSLENPRVHVNDDSQPPWMYWKEAATRKTSSSSPPLFIQLFQILIFPLQLRHCYPKPDTVVPPKKESDVLFKKIGWKRKRYVTRESWNRIEEPSWWCIYSVSGWPQWSPTRL